MVQWENSNATYQMQILGLSGNLAPLEHRSRLAGQAAELFLNWKIQYKFLFHALNYKLSVYTR